MKNNLPQNFLHLFFDIFLFEIFNIFNIQRFHQSIHDLIMTVSRRSYLILLGRSFIEWIYFINCDITILN